MTSTSPLDRAAPFLDLIRAHRSIRRFTTDPIPEERIREAVSTAQMASTSSNVQGYALVRVTDPAAREAIAEVAGPQRKVVECGAFFVVCGDTRRHRLLAARADEPYVGTTEAFIVSVIDASLFAQNLCLAFEAMGYGICYVGAIRNDPHTVDRVLGLPHGAYPLFGLCVGTPAEEPTPRPRLPVEAVLFENGYPSDERLLELVDEYDREYTAYMQRRGSSAKAWSAMMTGKYAEAQRLDVGPFYREKGADLS